MGSRSRIRWHKVFKLGVGVLGCLAVFLGLPSLIRRPEPPPLEPDIGLMHVAASREPAPSGQRPGPGRRAAKTLGRPDGRACRPAGALTRRIRLRRMTGRLRLPGSRRRGFRRSCSGTRSEDQGRLVAARHPTNREGVPPSTGSPATGAPAPAPAPVPVPAADTAPPPAPPAPPPTAPPPARAAAPQPTAPTEFGFER
jgi:hypothetical protein